MIAVQQRAGWMIAAKYRQNSVMATVSIAQKA
jgi:hypothetical protein